jgi:hypothetical protein
MIYQYVVFVNCDKLLIEVAKAGLPAPLTVTTVGDSISIEYTTDLSLQQEESLTSVINSHEKLTQVESLTEYLDQSIHPFTTKLIRTFAAENIIMGINNEIHSPDIIGIYSKKYVIANPSFPVSLKDCFDTGSLIVALQVLAHVRANENYTSLSPFIAEARIVEIMNKIEDFLQLPITPLIPPTPPI